MNKFLFKCAVFFALLCSTVAAHYSQKSDSWKPTLEQVREVENHIEMPEGTTLSDFRRYYSGRLDHGRRLLRGVFIKGETDPGIYIVAPEMIPNTLDGGCSVVNFLYDLDARKTLAVFCNGVG